MNRSCDYCTDPPKGIDEDNNPTCGDETCALVVSPLPEVSEMHNDDEDE